MAGRPEVPATANRTEAPTAFETSLEALLLSVQEERGFDLTGYKRSSLARRITKRMDARRCDGLDEYRALLRQEPDEFAALLDTILINVTSFFRDPDTWQVVAATVIPRVVADTPSEAAIRVWTPGCSTGQEAYTLAMLLCEELGEERFGRSVKIYATDADRDALSAARRARYDRAVVAESVPANFVERYFVAGDDGYAIRNQLRRAVVFGLHDLVKDPPISRVDLLVCRNTLMYFVAETQRRIVCTFGFAVRPSGYLLLGRPEALSAHTELFVPVDLRHRIFLRRGDPVVAHPKGLEPVAPARIAQEGGGLSSAGIKQVGFERGPTAQLLIDRDGVVVAVNHEAQVALGLGTPDVGRAFRDLEISYRPLELRSLLDEVALQREPSIVRDVEWVHGSDRRWFDVHVVPLLSPNGTVDGAGVAFVDASSSHTLGEQLRRLRHELDSVREELQSTVEELETANEELETTNEELQSTNEELETTNEDLQSINEELEMMNEELQSSNEELGTINDQLRVRTEDLDKFNKLLSTILASLRSAVVVVDRDVKVQVWNEQAHDLWGLRRDEVDGEHLMNLDIGLPVEQLRQPIRACLGGETDEVALDIDAVNRRGRRVLCGVRAMPLRTNGEVTGAILVMEATHARPTTRRGVDVVPLDAHRSGAEQT